MQKSAKWIFYEKEKTNTIIYLDLHTTQTLGKKHHYHLGGNQKIFSSKIKQLLT